MKIIILIIIMTAMLSFSGKSQGIKEWFNQRATQKEYMLTQIAALKLYIGYAEKGYSIAKDGLHTISDIKQSDFGQHLAYFTSLSKVNPAVKHNQVTIDFLNLNRRCLQNCRIGLRQIAVSTMLTAAEAAYLTKVFRTVDAECDQLNDEFNQMISDNASTLSDEQRIERLEMLKNAQQSAYEFSVSCIESSRALQRDREGQAKNLYRLKQLYNIK